MAKQSSRFICTQCRYISLRWIGCCPNCKEWETFQQEVQAVLQSTRSSNGQTPHTAPVTMTCLQNLSKLQDERLESDIREWDRVVGGGLMRGSLSIVTGDPGIGKSTLMLQMSNQIAKKYRVFYFSTEESLSQVKQRADRLSCQSPQLLFSDEANLEQIITTAEQEKPDLLIIDSIQNCYIPDSGGTPGGVSQLRDSAFLLMRLAKERMITIVLSGHITKEGTIAGPKILEHMVDAVFYLQGEDQWQTRVLRSVKNRFGTINELGFFEMEAHGLVEVSNINEHLVSEASHAPGSALISIIEGSRPLLLELQALTIESKMGIPQRVVSGVDHKQVVLIAAILEKYLHVRLSTHDIFFKVSGGFKIKSSSADLGIALALLSSYFQQPLPEKSITIGEINLTGHIKPISHMTMYIREAEKFGIAHLLVAKNQNIDRTECLVKKFCNVYDLLSLFTTQ